jgi:RNA polymerase sigma-70 factor, ECF subfamily
VNAAVLERWQALSDEQIVGQVAPRSGGTEHGRDGECLGVSEDVIKTRLSRARAVLRRDLFERAGLAASNAFRFERPRCDRVVATVMKRIG